MSLLEPREFSFPGKPYAVQQELMAAIYDAIEHSQIGLFESPTGTGKTLSIICASLTWLTANRFRKPDVSSFEDGSQDPLWVLEQMRSREERHVRDEFFRRKDAYRKRVEHASDRPRGSNLRRRKTCKHDTVRSDPPMDALLFSDDEADGAVAPRGERKIKSARIIFATRTHSQLTQFLEELRKTRFCPPGIADAAHLVKRTEFGERGLDLHSQLPLSVMLFGSRKQLCINEEVRSLQSSAAISERCRELTEAPVETTSAKRKRSRDRCVYKNEDSESVLSDRGMIQMLSIEELTSTGRKMGACPYYAARTALETGDVDVIGVPYSAVLHTPTRESLGVEIDENTIVIFDEAHNIVSTVCDLHSSVLTRPALEQSRVALKAYVTAYETRFSSANLYYLRQLIILSEGLLSLLPTEDGSDGNKLLKPKVILPSTMLFDAGVDNINLFSLLTFMKESRLSKKLRGFVDTAQLANHGAGPRCMEPANGTALEKDTRRAKQSVASFENFLLSIADCPSYGRIAMYPYRRSIARLNGGDQGIDSVARLKYFVTEPGQLFNSNVGRARATLLLGGTLTPRSAITEALFADVGQDSIQELECEHVVPADHLLTRVCETGPRGAQLEFTFRRRQRGEGRGEVGRALELVAREVSGGVIVFFASYELLNCTKQEWERDGTWGRLADMKGVYAEVRGENRAFEEYRAGVERDERRGGMLLAVMGGKLSEGINFSDALGRAVIMVGMPFANAMDVETGEMLKRLEGTRQRGEFLENGCMTVVNQCIGRAVRHERDFACVLLMDWRYGRERVVGKLPRFVRRDFAVRKDFGEVVGEVRRFFRDREVVRRVAEMERTCRACPC